MWYRINDKKVIVKSKKENKILLKIYLCGELSETKEFDTAKQADMYIALQQRVNEPIDCDLVLKPKKIKKDKK